MTLRPRALRSSTGRAILTFFLVCIVIAGVYGAATVSRRILLIQAVPALMAAALLWLNSA